jgi:hypothetical protein
MAGRMAGSDGRVDQGSIGYIKGASGKRVVVLEQLLGIKHSRQGFKCSKAADNKTEHGHV